MNNMTIKQLLAVAWLPYMEVKPSTQADVLNLGGRIIDTDLSRLDAKQIERCLNIGSEGLEGEYITI
jgi:hypothetical protein